MAIDASLPPATTRVTVAVPETFTQVPILTRYQLRDYLRSRRFILMTTIVVIIGGLFTALVAYYRPAGLLADSTLYYGTVWGNIAQYVVIFAGIIYGADAIAGEFQNKTGYFLMGLPIRRATVYVGKYLAALLAAFAALVMFALIIVANAAYYFGAGAVNGTFLESFALATLFLVALLGLTFLFSSLFKTSTYATLVVAVLFLFGFSILQSVITGLFNIEPWMVISYASPIIGNVFDSPYPAHYNPNPSLFQPMWTPTLVEGIVIMIGYFLIAAILGLILFEREEFS